MSTVPTEQEMQDAAKAPRVKHEEIHAEVSLVEYAYVGLMTLCVLTLHNGFKIVGQSSCASAENYNKEWGEKFALRDAERQIGQFLGFRICEQRYKEKLANDLVSDLGEGDCEGCKI